MSDDKYVMEIPDQIPKLLQKKLEDSEVKDPASLHSLLEQIKRVRTPEEILETDAKQLWEDLVNSEVIVDPSYKGSFTEGMQNIRITKVGQADGDNYIEIWDLDLCTSPVHEGILFFLKHDPVVGYRSIVRFNYRPGLMPKVTENDYMVLRTFEGGDKRTIHVVSSVFPKHTSIEFMTGAYPPLEFATIKNIGADWGIDKSSSDIKFEEGELFVECQCEPTLYDLEKGDGLDYDRAETSQVKAVPGYGVRELSLYGLDKLYNVDADQPIRIGDWHKKPFLSIYANGDEFVKLHFGIFGITGAGKSNFVTFLTRTIVDEVKLENQKPTAVIFDVSSEYSGLFFDRLCHGKVLLIFTDYKELATLEKRFYENKWPLFPKRILASFKNLTKKMKKELFKEILPHTKILLDSPVNTEWILREFFKGFYNFFISHPHISTLPQSGYAISALDAAWYEIETDLAEMVDISRLRKPKEITKLIQSMIVKLDDKMRSQFGPRLYSGSAPAYVYGLDRFSRTIKTLAKNESFLFEIFSQIYWVLSIYHEMRGSVLTYEDIFETMSHEDNYEIILFDGVPDDMRQCISTMLTKSLERRKKGVGRKGYCLFIIDEAHLFCPVKTTGVEESLESRSARAIENIVRQGRKFDLGVCLASQRVTHLNTSVMSQLNTWFAGQLIFPSDRNRISEAYGISEDLMMQTIYFTPGSWLVSSTKALGVRGAPIIIRAPNAEDQLLEFLTTI